MDGFLELPAVLKVRIASFLSPRDAVRLSKTSKALYDDLALAQLPMKIPFKSWYDDPVSGAAAAATTAAPHPKQGPKIPFLPHRTHSVTLTGSWSCRLGELQGRHYGANSHAQFYIVAYPLEYNYGDSSSASFAGKPDLDRRVVVGNNNRRSQQQQQQDENQGWLSGGGRIVWASRPLCQRHYHPSNSNSSWVKLTVTFVPSKEEEYYLCIQPGPGGNASQQQWWRHSLHMSNLIAHITYHDNPHTNFLMKRQYKTIVKHMQAVENRGAYYTKILEAVARSIRIQLARFGRNALDPVLESFFQSTGIPRDTDSLLVLEEIARFLSYYAYVNERQKKYNNSNTERESAKEEGANSNRDSIPDWVPYAESSVANRSSHDLSHNQDEAATTPFRDNNEHVRAAAAAAAIPITVPEQKQQHAEQQPLSSPRRRRRRLQKTVQSLIKFPSSFLKRANAFKGRGSGNNNSRQRGHRPSWRTDEITEEFSISVVPPEEASVVPPLEDQTEDGQL